MVLSKHTLRLTAAGVLDTVLPYTSYSVDDAEYLGTYDGSVDDCVAQLRDRGYHYQLFAATKGHPSRDVLDDGSFARIPERHPPEAADTGLAPLDARECQYHVQLFERDSDASDGVQTELYGHYEVHPYPHIPTWDWSRPWPRHYRPTWDQPDVAREEWTYLRGVTDSRLDPLLSDN